jgi:hypothetical protein
MTDAPLFDPAGWVVMPNGYGVPRDRIRPCGTCGATSFWVDNRGSPACPVCLPPTAGERATATLDVTTQVVTQGAGKEGGRGR